MRARRRVALTVAAGIAYYFAKQDIDARRRDQAARNSRSLDKKSWEQQLHEYDTGTQAKTAFSGDAPGAAPPSSSST